MAIVTPNHMHAPVAMQFQKRGIHVICDKPLTAPPPEAKRLAKAATASSVIFALTHNYTGTPMVRQARAMVAAGDLGDIRVVQVEYAQDWLAGDLESTGQKQAGWRTDPAQTGAGGSTGDIGTMPSTLPLSSPDWNSTVWLPTCKASFPGGGSMTTAISCCVLRAAHGACSGAAR